MDLTLFFIFLLLTTLNVIAGTVKSIATVKGSKLVAAFTNAAAYAINTIAVIYTVSDLPLWAKASVVFLVNLIGVFLVKHFEEKCRKDKLWKIECTVPDWTTMEVDAELTLSKIPHSYIRGVGKYAIFNIYSASKAESSHVKRILAKHGAKYFVSEGVQFD